MKFRCVDCKVLTKVDNIVVLNGTKDNQILFVCEACVAKPKLVQSEKKEEVKGKLESIFEVIGGGK
jgi:hypothetical protein